MSVSTASWAVVGSTIVSVLSLSLGAYLARFAARKDHSVGLLAHRIEACADFLKAVGDAGGARLEMGAAFRRSQRDFAGPDERESDHQAQDRYQIAEAAMHWCNARVALVMSDAVGMSAQRLVELMGEAATLTMATEAPPPLKAMQAQMGLIREATQKYRTLAAAEIQGVSPRRPPSPVR